MKGLFKSKPRTPGDVVRQTRSLLIYLDSNADRGGSKRDEKMAELNELIRELKSILYGNSESEPAMEACAQLTQEFFRENTLRLLIICLPKLNLEARKDAAQVVANLQRQQVHFRLIASDYLEANLDLMDHLISGYEDPSIALHYGGMLRECIRHQCVARYVLESGYMKKFFDYMQLPNFDVAADATSTFKELLTRHKSTVAEFLSRNYDWFFAEFNSKLLESTNYITKRQAIKLLGDMLLDRSNSAVMIRYVSSKDNLMILMNLLRESSKNIQIDAFHVFKLFAANVNKPPDIVNILVANRSKLLRFFGSFKIDKDDEHFEADKAQIVKEIAELEPKNCP
uniref:MO25-like protein n=1 Tax=Davidia involucrata TaxID=16924 RepID=A0A5B7BGE9_DAVIN